MPSVAEQILARVQVALVTAAIVATDLVSRGREDAWGEDELPAINIIRAGDDQQNHAERLTRHVLTFDIQHLAVGTAWETVADALHMQVHAVLLADAQLQAIGRGLTCTGTEAQGASADIHTARLTAHYQIQFITRPSDLTRAIN